MLGKTSIIALKQSSKRIQGTVIEDLVPKYLIYIGCIGSRYSSLIDFRCDSDYNIIRNSVFRLPYSHLICNDSDLGLAGRHSACTKDDPGKQHVFSTNSTRNGFIIPIPVLC